jgi:hypothetical protein
MNEENDIYQQEIPEEDDAMMPDGWAEGDDFFEPESWTGKEEAESASADPVPESDTASPEEAATEEAPAIEQTEEPVPADTGAAEEGVPATEPETPAPSTKRRVRYQFDHQDLEEEIDDADLPELLQKARSVDRYKERLSGAQNIRDRLDRTAKALKYDSGEAFLDAILENAKSSEMDALRDKGVPDEIAEDYIGRKYADASAIQFQPTQPQPQQPQLSQPSTGDRDYVSEARELLTVHPELVGKTLPQEVYATANRPGTTLLQAYTEYERRQSQAEAEQARSEAEKLRKENRILKNNADSADRAPVSGVSKGGRASDKAAETDPFLRGFDSDDW